MTSGAPPASAAVLHEATEFARVTALGHLQDGDAADDVAQEVATVVWRRVAQLRSRQALSRWLHRVTLNAVRQHLRSERRRERRLGRLAVELDQGSVPGPVDALLLREAIARVRRVVEALPAAQRAAVALVAVEGLSYAEAAGRLGVGAATVRANLCRARTTVRRLLPPSEADDLKRAT